MNKKDEDLMKDAAEISSETKEVVTEFTLEKATAATVSSAEVVPDNEYIEDWLISDDMDEILELDAPQIKRQKAAATADLEAENITAEVETEEMSPIFRELAEPKLPELPRENRARLQMQSPTKLYFYWSVKNNPFQTLNRVFRGNTGNYTLVTKLKNKTTGTEELFSVEPEGNWWFDVKADTEYVAELGFYAPNRPFVRVMFSNEVRTPRKNPSKRRDYTPYFNVNAHQFAEVLDAAGYQRDAFEVAFTGDDEMQADFATNKTYQKLVGDDKQKFTLENDGDELRFVLLALASGYSLADIRHEINPKLYDFISDEIEKLSAEQVLSALKENFDMFTEELFEDEEFGEAVFGASLVNFPKRIKKRSVPKSLSPKESKFPQLSKFSPVSSAEFSVSS